ncbi:MAG: ricin-type beta-trefoil lectin domain protein, partial [Actinobacteria bacterium]|nr:ricin-type beta-trefoil lectin domain protein [Actinomycetota bacterium]
CNGSAQQNWTLVQDNTMRIHGKCLTLSSGHAVLSKCTGSAAQHWRVGTGDELVNASTSKCLAGSATANGAQAWTGGCTPPASNKEWKLVAGPVVSGISGKCLDDSGNSSANLTKIVVSACNSTAEQKWVAEPDGTVRIHGKCLRAVSGGTTSGTLVDLYSCTGSTAQQWQIPASGSGSTLVNVKSGLCLADPNDNTADGTQAVIQTCSAADPGMAWRVR